MSRAFREAKIDPLDRVAVNKFCDVDCSNDKILTVQAPADQVDINKIVKRMEKGLAVPTFNGEPWYGDVSEITGLQDALIKVQQAEELFMQYPAELREKFENDPTKFVDFMSNPENTDEAIKLGLALPKPKQEEAPPAPITPA